MSVIHGVPLSPFVRKLMIFMDEKGLNYEQKPVKPGDESDAFRRLSPLGKVPAYSDDQIEISDSSVICAYLEKAHPTPALYPQDPVRYAQALWLEEYADTRFMEATGPLYFQTCLARRFFGREPDADRIADVSQRLLPPALDYVETRIPPDGFLFGERPGVADCALGTNLINLEHAGFAVDATRHPRLTAYRDRLLERAAFARARARERALLADHDSR